MSDHDFQPGLPTVKPGLPAGTVPAHLEQALSSVTPAHVVEAASVTTPAPVNPLETDFQALKNRFTALEANHSTLAGEVARLMAHFGGKI